MQTQTEVDVVTTSALAVGQVVGARTVAQADAVLRYCSALVDEMRGPLGALAGLTELLAAQAGTESAGTESAGAIRDHIRGLLSRMRTLCDDAGDSAAVALGQVELRREPVDLAEVVAQTVAGRMAFVPPGPVVVHGDRHRLRQIVQALLGAAALAGGRVEASLRRQGSFAEFTATSNELMPVDVIQGLFEPFSRPPAAGEGLGLYVCRGLAVAHGGEVGAHADKGGTSLWLRIPLP